MAACQTVWLETIFKEMEIEVSIPITLFIDNKSTINLAKNPVLHGRSKHIEAKFRFLREQSKQGSIEDCSLFY
jgi:hypothetical protein